MERSLEIKQYRNLGIYGDKPERLVLNYTTEKGKMGDLIILIGPNNSGKSNVLDALKQYFAKTLTQQDETLLETESKYHKPDLRLVTKDGSDIYFNGIIWNGTKTETYEKMIIKSKSKDELKIMEITKSDKDELLKNLNTALDIVYRRSRYDLNAQKWYMLYKKLIDSISRSKDLDDIPTIINQYLIKDPIYDQYLKRKNINKERNYYLIETLESIKTINNSSIFAKLFPNENISSVYRGVFKTLCKL